MIPEPDGFAVCRLLRDEGRWAPVLILTARDSVEDRVRGLDAGADDYLTKPFAFEELFARLRALTRRGPVERPIVLRVGDLTLDPVTRGVSRGGQVVGAVGQGVRPARVPDAPSGRGAEPHPDHRARVGLRLRGRLQRGRRLRPVPAREGRPSLRTEPTSRPCGVSATASATRRRIQRRSRSPPAEAPPGTPTPPADQHRRSAPLYAGAVRLLPSSLRSRLAVLFALGSAALLFVFTFGLYHVLDRQLLAAVDSGLKNRATDLAVVASGSQGQIPDRDPFAQTLTLEREGGRPGPRDDRAHAGADGGAAGAGGQRSLLRRTGPRAGRPRRAPGHPDPDARHPHGARGRFLDRRLRPRPRAPRGGPASSPARCSWGSWPAPAGCSPVLRSGRCDG